MSLWTLSGYSEVNVLLQLQRLHHFNLSRAAQLELRYTDCHDCHQADIRFTLTAA